MLEEIGLVLMHQVPGIFVHYSWMVRKGEQPSNVVLASVENMQIGIAICLRSTYCQNIILSVTLSTFRPPEIINLP
jgi:hypothetical protein